MIQIFLFSSKCVLGLLSKDTRHESDDTARNIFLFLHFFDKSTIIQFSDYPRLSATAKSSQSQVV